MKNHIYQSSMTMGRVIVIFVSILTAGLCEMGSDITSSHDLQPTENLTIYGHGKEDGIASGHDLQLAENVTINERENTTEANDSQHGIHLAALNIEHVESKIL